VDWEIISQLPGHSIGTFRFSMPLRLLSTCVAPAILRRSGCAHNADNIVGLDPRGLHRFGVNAVEMP
jgi:hypothetical protein